MRWILLATKNYMSPVETNFSPMIDPIKSRIKNIRQKYAGSSKKKIPIKTVPTAPIPVQTA